MFAVSIAGALILGPAVRDAGAGDGPATASAPEFEHAAGATRGTGTFSAVARAAGAVPVDWRYRGSRAHLQVRARLERFVRRGEHEIVCQTIAEACPTSRFGTPSGGFSYSGRVVFEVLPGDVYGFRISSARRDGDVPGAGGLALAR